VEIFPVLTKKARNSPWQNDLMGENIKIMTHTDARNFLSLENKRILIHKHPYRNDKFIRCFAYRAARNNVIKKEGENIYAGKTYEKIYDHDVIR
jgi:hypothetical protein